MANQEQFRASLETAIEEGETPAEETPSSEPDPKAGETPPPGKEPPDPEEPATVPDPEAEEPPAEEGLKEKLAEAGLDIAEFYKLKIPGTDITFGDAKDAAPDLGDISRLKLDTEQKRDDLENQLTEGRQQLGATIHRLAAVFGKEKVQAALGEAPADVTQAKAAVKEELIRWRPELKEEAAYAQAMDDIAGAAARYGIPRSAMEGANAQLQRAFLRLAKLEGYLDSVRKPAKPPKKVRGASRKKPAGGKKRSSRTSRSRNRGVNKFRESMEGALKE